MLLGSLDHLGVHRFDVLQRGARVGEATALLGPGLVGVAGRRSVVAGRRLATVAVVLRDKRLVLNLVQQLTVYLGSSFEVGITAEEEKGLQL